MAAPAPILDFTGLPVVASDRSLLEFKPNDLSLQSVTYQHLYLYMGLLEVWIGEGLCVLGRGSCYRNLRCERFIVLKTSFSRQNLWCLSLYHTILWQNSRCWALLSSVSWRLKIRLSSVTCKSHTRMNKTIVACFANISMPQSSIQSLKNSRVLVVRSSSSG